jgi:hypothetical protein
MESTKLKALPFPGGLFFGNFTLLVSGEVVTWRRSIQNQIHVFGEKNRKLKKDDMKILFRQYNWFSLLVSYGGEGGGRRKFPAALFWVFSIIFQWFSWRFV